MQSTPAAVIRLRVEQFDKRARELELATDDAAAKFIGVNPGTLSRIRSGDTVPGERFIAACLASEFAASFEELFEIEAAS